jgi:hypothetical protein
MITTFTSESWAGVGPRAGPLIPVKAQRTPPLGAEADGIEGGGAVE